MFLVLRPIAIAVALSVCCSNAVSVNRSVDVGHPPAPIAVPDRLVLQFRDVSDLKILELALAGETALDADSSLSPLIAELRLARATSAGPAIYPLPDDAALAARLGLDRFVVVDLPGYGDTQPLAARLAADFSETLVGAWPDPIVHQHGTPPNDPGFGQQWHLFNQGQVIAAQAGVPGADIRWLEAMSIAVSPAPIVVAVLDSGVSISHPDLFGQLVPGCNITSTTNPSTDDSAFNSHGTKCAGIIAAVRNNGQGIAGVAPNARIMPVKMFGASGISSGTWGANAITCAADGGAHVLSMSWGFDAATSGGDLLRTASLYAHQRGCLLVASTGNTPGSAIGVPAAWPEVIAVGATNNRDELFAATTTGPELDLVAPGEAIYTTVDQSSNPNGYGAEYGTSFAAPIVTGVASLVWGINPDLNAAQVRGILEVSVRDLGAAGYDPVFGLGRIDAYSAVREAVATLPPCPADLNGNHAVDAGDLFFFFDIYFGAASGGGQIRFADFDRNGIVDVGDVFAYLTAWFAGC